MNRITFLSLTLVLACSSTTAPADVKLPAIFGDHMVVQRGAKVPIWGTADPDERVAVKAGGRESAVNADAQGKWRVVLDPIEADAPFEITIAGKNTVTIKDVLVGEVWLCSGQSNMGFPLKRAANGSEAVKAANRPTMRLFTVGRATKDEPQTELTGRWEVCTPEAAADFSAVAYFFGAELQDKLKTPVGLIEPSWGGTRAEAWMPRSAFDALELPYEPAWTEQWLNPKPDPKTKKPTPPRPHQAPAALYNGMVAPLAGYGIRGAIWYQGESNTAYPAAYADVLAALVTSWRAAWGQGDFPFLVVQLPNLVGSTRDWVTMRGSQARVARELPNVGLAVTIDVGESRDIHPKEKLTVGKRLALLAEKIAYGRDVVHSGPAISAVDVIGADVVLQFDHVAGALAAKGDELLGFEVAGADGKFVPAAARIDGERVIVRAQRVAAPKSVRYAWSNDPNATLYNKAGLPAAPFEATVK